MRPSTLPFFAIAVSVSQGCTSEDVTHPSITDTSDLGKATGTDAGGTDGEPSPPADGGSRVDGGTPAPSTGLGCYMQEIHVCDCELDEAACGEAEGIWTDGCDRCSETEADAGALGANTSTDAGAGAELGCYMPADFACDCELDEGACAGVEGIWTDGCSSCFE